MSKPTPTFIGPFTGFVLTQSLRGKRGKGKHTAYDYKAIAQRVAADIAHSDGLSIRAAASQYLDTSHDDFENHIRGVERALKAQSYLSGMS